MKNRFNKKTCIVFSFSLFIINSFQISAQNKMSLETGFYYIIPNNEKNAFVVRSYDSLSVNKTPFLTVKEFEKINLLSNPYGYYNLIILNDKGKKILKRATLKYLNKNITFIINGELISIISIRGIASEGKISFSDQNNSSKRKGIQNYKQIRREMNLDTAYFNVKQYALLDIDFDKMSTYESHKRGRAWRESHDDIVAVCTDKELILELKKQVFFIDNETCNDKNATKAIHIFKNNIIIGNYYYCDSNQSNLLNFKDNFHLTKLYNETFNSKKELLEKYNKLKMEGSCLGIETIPPSQYLIGDGCLRIDLLNKENPKDTTNYIKNFTKELKNLLKIDESDISVSEFLYTNNNTSTKIVANIRCTNEYGKGFDKKVFQNVIIFNSVGRIDYIEDQINSDDFNRDHKVYKIFYRK